MADRYLSVIPSINSCHCLRAAPEVGENNEFPGTCGMLQGQPNQASEAKGKVSGEGVQVLMAGS